MADCARPPNSAATDVKLRAAGAIHAHALSVLEECVSEQEKIYAVACAGATWCGTKFPTERTLFTVLEDFAADHMLFSTLGRLINELGQSAGSNHVEGANHG